MCRYVASLGVDRGDGRFAVVGNPGNRRVALFPAAAAAAGLPAPRVRALARRAARRAARFAAGRDRADRLARRGRRGGPAAARRRATRPGSRAPPAGTRGSPAPSGAGREAAARGGRDAAGRPRTRSPSCSTSGAATPGWTAAGVPVPPRRPPAPRRRRCAAGTTCGRGWRGRAAPGVRQARARLVRLRGARRRVRRGPGRVRATTSVERDRRTARCFNSLRVRRYDDERDDRGDRRRAGPGRAARRALAAQGGAGRARRPTCGSW